MFEIILENIKVVVSLLVGIAGFSTAIVTWAKYKSSKQKDNISIYEKLLAAYESSGELSKELVTTQIQNKQKDYTISIMEQKIASLERKLKEKEHED